MRPRQWIKNALVVAAAGAAGALGHDDVPVRVAISCVAFCLLASGIYAINDVRDAAEDRPASAQAAPPGRGRRAGSPVRDRAGSSGSCSSGSRCAPASGRWSVWSAWDTWC